LPPGSHRAAPRLRRARGTRVGPVGDLPLAHPLRCLPERDRHAARLLPRGALPVGVAAGPGCARDAFVLDPRRADHRGGAPDPMTEPTRFTEEQVQRYSRHIILPNIGAKGQRKLLDGSVLVIGAGGLGSPIAMYLAAAGVGKLGIVDFDHVDL